jgi:hypothetical protein
MAGHYAAGYCLGTLFVKGYDAAKRRRQLLWMGSAAIIIFLVAAGSMFMATCSNGRNKKIPPAQCFRFLMLQNTRRHCYISV